MVLGFMSHSFCLADVGGVGLRNLVPETSESSFLDSGPRLIWRAGIPAASTVDRGMADHHTSSPRKTHRVAGADEAHAAMADPALFLRQK